MNRSGYLLLGLTAFVGMLAGVLAFAVSKFFSAARSLAKEARPVGAETHLMASAMEDAFSRLREQERATKARAEASERVSGEIIASMTSGLLVVDEEGRVRTLNPAALKMLGMSATTRKARSWKCWPALRRSPALSTSACVPGRRSFDARCR